LKNNVRFQKKNDHAAIAQNNAQKRQYLRNSDGCIMVDEEQASARSQPTWPIVTSLISAHHDALVALVNSMQRGAKDVVSTTRQGGRNTQKNAQRMPNA